jgi:adenylate kinase family enzyme
MPLNVHVMGLAGSGKTTLARWFEDTFTLSTYDLDWIVYDEHHERPLEEIARRIKDICASNGWVTEGAYQEEWIEPLLASAESIVWLDLPLHTCIFRMVKRHVQAELARNNQHPGWRRLLGFLNYTRRTSQRQRLRTGAVLAPHFEKVHHCQTSSDVSSFKAALVRARGS